MSHKISKLDCLEDDDKMKEMTQMAAGDSWLTEFIESIRAPPDECENIAFAMAIELFNETPHNQCACLFNCLPILRICPRDAFDLLTNPLKIALEVGNKICFCRMPSPNT